MSLPRPKRMHAAETPDARADAARPVGAVRLRPVGRIGGAYSRFVALAKVLLPLVALGLVVLVAAWPSLDETGRDRVATSDDGSLEMVNARYHGADSSGQPYTVAAAKAVESTSRPGILDLVRPEGEMLLEAGNWLAVRAREGRYVEEDSLLVLGGDVDLFHDEGYEFRTEELHVDVAEASAWGDRPVVGQGPSGVLTAEGVRIAPGGTSIVFTGRARLVLHGSGAP